MTDHHIACQHDQIFTFEPSKTALLVIDMQKDFLLSVDGSENEMASIVPAVGRLTDLCRRLGCTIVHTREAYRPDFSDVSPHKADMKYVGRPGPFGRYLVAGEPGCDFVEDLRPQPGEQVFDKPGFGAFGTTDLHDHLVAAGISHLILCGVTMQCCVHSTLREAVDRGYWCLTVADCCGALRPEWHAATLSLIASEDHLFGGICCLNDLVGAAPSNDARRHAPAKGSAGDNGT